ncbi:hypothetical protein GGF31_000600 [Allomyces arbusculus]|nr:hypothetical protein GGF31_000600 [Allomyces arbusculus]
MGTAYAACMASGNPNTPYCPHNAGNREAPTAETKIVPGQPVRVTWNSQWSPFAAAGAIDLYLCPADASACVPLAMGVKTAVESRDVTVDSKAVLAGSYNYVVVPLGGVPETVPFAQRGVGVTVLPPPSTTTTATSSTSTTAPPLPHAATAPPSVPTAASEPRIATSAPTSSRSSTSLTPLQIALIAISAMITVLAIGLAVVHHHRRRKHHDLAVAVLAGTSTGSAPRTSCTPTQLGTSLKSVPPCSGPAASTVVPTPTPVPRPSTSSVPPPVGAISSTDAIILANTFKAALKHPLDHSDDDADLHTMMANLGLLPVASPETGEPVVFVATSAPPPAPTTSSSARLAALRADAASLASIGPTGKSQTSLVSVAAPGVGRSQGSLARSHASLGSASAAGVVRSQASLASSHAPPPAGSPPVVVVPRPPPTSPTNPGARMSVHGPSPLSGNGSGGSGAALGKVSEAPAAP